MAEQSPTAATVPLWGAVLKHQIAARNSVERDPFEHIFVSQQRLRKQLLDAQALVLQLQTKTILMEKEQDFLRKSGHEMELVAKKLTDRVQRQEELEARCAQLEKQENQRVTDEIQRLAEQNKQMKVEVTILKQRDEEREAQLTSVRMEYEGLKQENEHLRRLHCAAQNDLVSAKGSTAAQKKEVLELKQTLQRLGGGSDSMGTFPLSNDKAEEAQGPQDSQDVSFTASRASVQRLLPSKISSFPTHLERSVENASKKALTAICISDVNSRLFTCGSDDVIREWNTEKLQQTLELKAPGTPQALHTASHYLLAGCANTVALFWDLNSKRSAQLSGHKGPIVAVSLSPSGRFAYTAATDGTVKLWDLKTQAIQDTKECSSSCCDVSTASGFVLTAHHDGSIRQWDGRIQKEANIAHIHKKPVTCVRGTSGGYSVVSLGRDNFLRVRDVRNPTIPLCDISHPAISVVTNTTRFALSPDGRIAAVGNSRGEVLCFDVSVKRGVVYGDPVDPLVHLKHGHNTAIQAVAWGSPESTFVASIGCDKKLCVWTG